MGGQYTACLLHEQRCIPIHRASSRMPPAYAGHLGAASARPRRAVTDRCSWQRRFVLKCGNGGGTDGGASGCSHVRRERKSMAVAAWRSWERRHPAAHTAMDVDAIRVFSKLRGTPRSY
ncbi:hypothetical protein E2562_026781 [Oryza meyeriana var. granulata]|uniref:Uncharacterized protein n=1 Tax=Oryza meyeriana var. granulata TaxID=110450 RepID=A0A6G1C863_9ORYZ|nr:hypothetical protein E2562_026781 [Oryza meyeriana var. granulata]